MTFDQFVAHAIKARLPRRVWAHSAANGDELEMVMKSLGRFKTIVEVGTYEGVSACILSRFADHVHTYDNRNWGHCKQVLKIFGVRNVTRHLVRHVSEELPAEFDFAFVDARHHYSGVKADFAAVRKCPVVLIHDCFDRYPGVQKFCREIGAVPVRKHFALWRQ